MDSPWKGKQTKSPEKIGSRQEREGRRGGEKWSKEENMREWEGQDGGRTERESRERDI